MKPRGRVTVDAGAVAALGAGQVAAAGRRHRVEGGFRAATRSRSPGPTGRGGGALAGYDAGEARIIMGHRSDRIAELLGYPGRAALVHRDDLAI